LGEVGASHWAGAIRNLEVNSSEFGESIGKYSDKAWPLLRLGNCVRQDHANL